MRERTKLGFRGGLVLVGLGAALSLNCSSSGDEDASNVGSGGSSGGAGGGGGSSGNDGGAGITGFPCGDNKVYAGTTCCDLLQACGEICCGGTDVCSFGSCQTPGADCNSQDDCGTSEYCNFALGDPPGASGSCSGSVARGKCLDKPASLDQCQVSVSSNFDLVERVNLPARTMMVPLVINLDDDNCNGRVDAEDVPEIVYSSGSTDGVRPLIVTSLIEGQPREKYQIPNAVRGASNLAAGDLDGDGVAEIVGIGPSGETVVAYHGKDGSPYWTSPDLSGKVIGGYESPAIADPFKNGKPVVLVGFTLINGQTGQPLKTLANRPVRAAGEQSCSIQYIPNHTYAGFADLNGDGTLDVTDGAQAFEVSGTRIWDFRDPNQVSQNQDRESGYHAVGDLDKDGTPEVVYTSYGKRQLNVVHLDPVSRQPTKLRSVKLDGYDGTLDPATCSRKCTGGGPPTVADFNGDGFPDVGVAGAIGYIVFDGKQLMADPGSVPPENTVLWARPTTDCSSAFTGSSVFDFDGNGKAEVVYADERNLWVYDGTTGMQLNPTTPNNSSTIGEMAIVADVDNDGSADLLLPDLDGIHIFGSPNGNWVRTRRIWNQHTYHVTNINEDGTVPRDEAANWTVAGLNNFRQNVQPGQEFLAGDITVNLVPSCSNGLEVNLTATVSNVGQVAAPPGLSVEYYAGEPPNGTSLGSGKTTRQLGPGQSERVQLTVTVTQAQKDGTTYAVVNSGAAGMVGFRECRTDNNLSKSVPMTCLVP